MENKICPLLLLGNPSNVNGRAECQSDRCGWWSYDRCGVADMGRNSGDLQVIAEAITDS